MSDANPRTTEVLLQCQKAFDDLFAHCLSNGVFNRWGEPMNCTSTNVAKAAVDDVLRNRNQQGTPHE